MTLKLSRQFNTPEDAELHFVAVKLTSLDVADEDDGNKDDLVAEKKISKLLQEIISKSDLGIQIPDDFISISVAAMQHLKACKRTNVIYGIAKALGTKRQDGSDSARVCI